MKRLCVVLVLGVLLLPLGLPARADDPDPLDDSQVYEETSQDKLIEMSIVLGRLERLRANLKAGESSTLEDLRSAIGKARGPQQRLLAEKQALELLRSRLEMLKEQTPPEEEALPKARLPTDDAVKVAVRKLGVQEALEVMGPPALPENSRALADLLRETGHHSLALDAYRRIPKAERTPWDRFNKAICLERLGRLTRARAEYRAVATLAKTTPLGEHARWVAETYLPMLAETLQRSSR